MIGPKIVRGYLWPFVHGGNRTENFEGHLFQVKQELRPVHTAEEAAGAQTGESVARRSELAAAVPSDLTWKWIISEQHVTPFLTGENQPYLRARFAVGKVVSEAMMRIAMLETAVSMGMRTRSSTT